MASFAVEVIDNAVHANPAGDDERLEEDSNAIVCPDWFGDARRKLVNAETGEPTAIVRALPYLAVIRVLGNALHLSNRIGGSPQGLSARGVLLLVAVAAFWVLSFSMSMIVFELSRLLRKGGRFIGFGKTGIMSHGEVTSHPPDVTYRGFFGNNGSPIIDGFH